MATKRFDALNLLYGQSITLYLCLTQWLHYYMQRSKNWFLTSPSSSFSSSLISRPFVAIENFESLFTFLHFLASISPYSLNVLITGSSTEYSERRANISLIFYSPSYHPFIKESISESSQNRFSEKLKGSGTTLI